MEKPKAGRWRKWLYHSVKGYPGINVNRAEASTEHCAADGVYRAIIFLFTLRCSVGALQQTYKPSGPAEFIAACFHSTSKAIGRPRETKRLLMQ